MAAHEPDLRAEIHDPRRIEAIQSDFRQADLDVPTRTLLEFAVKLTLQPRDMTAQDVDGLRAAGFQDETIVDAVQTIAYFNYANRVMDALGVEPEPEMNYRSRA